jgi:hypothetical protein
MTEFKSWQSYRVFQRSVKRHTRYIYSDETNQFLKSVIETSEGRKREIPIGKIFWRAQQGNDWQTSMQDNEEFEVEAPHLPERMKPLENAATEGRANPKGIPCLYLATDKETAMAEVRPWIGSFVSVGQFKTLKALKLVDLSVHQQRKPLYLEEPDAPGKESAVWAHIDRSFSEPITTNDTSADYAPTQVLSELFRQHGYDGLVYKSLLGEGFNIALFDLTSAALINRFLYQVESMSFKFNKYC